MRQAPSRKFVDFAHAVMDTGVDIFHGHSAHIFQGVEIYKGKAILYDTGDLIDDYMVDPVLRNDQQLLFVIEATVAGVERIELVPLLIDRMQVNRARGADFRTIGERIARLSRPFGTEIRREGERFVIQVRREK
jgi:poly-gamma-glutamate synthesis protein (capsule biosynthesis protein)